MAKEQTEPQGQSGIRILLKGGVTILAFLLLGYLVKSLDFESLFQTIGFEQGSNRGKLTYVLLATGLICIGAPRQIISFFAAFFFGLGAGFLVALLSTTCGCVISYSLARVFSRYFQQFVRGKLDTALSFWRKNTLIATMIWRFLPVGNNLLSNLAAGAFKIPPVKFVAGSAIGYVPQTLVFAVMGSGVNVESNAQIAISIGLFVLSAMMGLYLYARYKRELKED